MVVLGVVGGVLAWWDADVDVRCGVGGVIGGGSIIGGGVGGRTPRPDLKRTLSPE